MNIENTPEYQEHRLKIEGIKWIEKQIESLQGSLVTGKNELLALNENLLKTCKQIGHNYGKEYPVKLWEEKMVQGSCPSLSPMDGYDSDYEPPMIDKGRFNHYVHKECRGCGYINKRNAKVTYS